ncbi:mycofactocin system FadH/OYE family oxidoreductase 2 [Actinomycetospora succinea]|uniref:Mycofactocin system FadH/OYE family oxidoreductase 2 n=1 Tax=Actinomycetospora succinea TaxID=663603 RepID=A0A4V3DAL2_9PSEU|nr:FAD-dependent oxidoreductase [Actinomycetospora succinea]TDQ62713.1 mycofactocin system FadH/OYE family oxidoreductase 2 [Actinomycetospora succinea]
MSVLGEPVRLGPLVARNRIVFPAHLTNAAVARLPTAQHAAYYGARAAGGAGLVITEEQSVDPADRPYEKLVDGTDPAVVAGYRAIADAVHGHGALVLAQLGHNGGQSSSIYSRAPVDGADDEPDPMFREVPRVLSDAALARLVDGFGLVASHVAAGGLDGVEVQCSQASLIRQLFSARSPRAEPFLLAVLRAVRAAIGPDRVLGVRVQGDEGLAGGLVTEDAVRVAVAVEPLVDYVNTAVGVATRTLPLIEPPMGVPAGYAAHVPSAVRAAVSVPVIGVGRFTTPEQATEAVASGSCDLVGVVRGQIADPSFAAKALRGERVRRCIGCNQECIARVGLNQRLGCAVNPAAGRESVSSPPVASGGARVLVVGGGPAGLAAAVAAARAGHAVTLAERSDVLGGQLALASRAPERRELANLVADLAHEARDLGVVVRLRTPVGSVDGVDAVVLATGARPALPPWAGGLERVVDVTDVLAGRVAPSGRVLVVDAGRGHPATSTAELLARRGADVAMLTPALVAADALAPTLDRERWRRRAAEVGVAEYTDRVVLAAREGLVVDVLEHLTGTVTPWPADWVVHAGPPTPEVPDLGVPAVRVGDCLAPRGIDAAVREGTAAGRSM